MGHLFRATILNPQSDTFCETFADGGLLTNDDGLILTVGPFEQVSRDPRASGAAILPFPDSLILPAFCDVHLHWVQDDVRLLPKINLLDWLHNYTFPAEARYAEPEFAFNRARIFSNRLLSQGTLAGAIYSSLHASALQAIMKHVHGHFIAGNVLMTMNAPSYLIQTPLEAENLLEMLALTYKHQYAVTPRFAVACHPEVMCVAAEVASQQGCWVQTHLAESHQEVAWTLETFRHIPGFATIRSYTEIYDRCGLLGPRTILGHCIHMSDAEYAKLASCGCRIAHCPSSNAPIVDLGLGSGLMDFERVEAHGIVWALASDIGAGPYLSMLDVMQSFVRQHANVGRVAATPVKALYHATRAGAQVLGLEQVMGSLDPGKEANFLVLPHPMPGGNHQDANTVLGNLLACERSRFESVVEQTWFRGKKIWSKESLLM